MEDNLAGIWQDYALAKKIPAFYNQVAPYRALDFWSRPELEIELAQQLGVQVFRLGVDWQRIEPTPGKYDLQALDHYLQIITMIKKKGMKVMLTLFHHAEPRWSLRNGSWKNEEMIGNFVRFSKVVLEKLGPNLDYVITLNEAHVYVLLGQISGLWPSPTDSADYLGMIDLGVLHKGSYTISLENMSMAPPTLFDFCTDGRV